MNLNWRYGWIDPNGVFEICASYMHAKAKCLDHIWEETGAQDRVDATERSCQAAADAGEHPEWHCYEMAQDAANAEVCREAVKRGFVRVGVRDGCVHFEFAQNKFSAAQKQACEDIAEERGFTPVWEPATWLHT